MKTVELMIYPKPRKCEVGQGVAKVPELLKISGVDYKAVEVVFGLDATVSDAENAWIRCSLGAPLKGGHEAYKLSVKKSGVEIEAQTRLGALQALRSVKQLRRQFPEAIPCLEIEDWPEFPIRGAMLDISRDRVPTMGTLYELIDKLAEMKLNHFQLYVEHTFAYAGHEAVWRDASPITPEEMRAIDAYCADRGVELCANQNCLGHMERWLKHPRYASLGEMERPHYLDIWGGFYAEPNTLEPSNTAGLSLLRDILGQIVPCCSGRFVNIGCDEPIDIGHGKSMERCKTNSKLKVYGDHVSKVARMVLDLGRRPQFWADPDFGNKRDEIPDLPKELIGLIWGYDENLDFKPRVESFIASGLETWVAPGANGWLSFTGRTNVRRANLEHAAEARKLGAVGFLNTEWGDLGYRQQFPIDLLGLAEGAYASWTGKAPTSAKAAGLHLFNDPATGEWLEKLGLVDDSIRTGNSNASFRDTMYSFFDPEGAGTLEEWRKIKESLKPLEKSMPQGHSLMARECRQAFDALSWAVERAILRRDGKLSPENKNKLIKQVLKVAEEHRSLWLVRSRPGGLTDSMATYKTHLKHL